MLKTLARDWGGPLAFGFFNVVGWCPIVWIIGKFMGWL